MNRKKKRGKPSMFIAAILCTLCALSIFFWTSYVHYTKIVQENIHLSRQHENLSQRLEELYRLNRELISKMEGETKEK